MHVTSAVADDLVSALEQLMRAQRATATSLAHEVDWPRGGLGVLRLLAACGPVPLTDVAARLRVNLSVASRQVSGLVDKGYVARTVDPHDRRVRTLELTESGHALAAQVREHFVRYLATAFADWTADDLTAVVVGLDRLTRTLDAHTLSPKE